jgi:hypothetical protein
VIASRDVAYRFRTTLTFSGLVRCGSFCLAQVRFDGHTTHFADAHNYRAPTRGIENAIQNSHKGISQIQ